MTQHLAHFPEERHHTSTACEIVTLMQEAAKLGPSDGLRPDGHFKFLHLWPVKFLQAGQVNYQSFCPPGAGPLCL